MEIVQILIGSMFSLIAMASVLYIAFRAHTIAGDVTEIRKLLEDQRKPSTIEPGLAPLERAVAASRHAPGDWPSVMDADYNTEDPASKPSESPR